MRLTVHPLTPDRWNDFVALFGPRGAYGGCWCMYFRRPRSAWSAGCKDGGAGNRRAFGAIVRREEEPGLLAYAGDEPVGWCAVAPRAVYGTLARSRTLQPVDDVPVWSVTCFYVAKAWRGRGVTVALLKAAARFVKGKGGAAVEGYPVDPAARWPDSYAYQGTVGAYERAGYREIKRVSKGRAIYRKSFRKP